MATMRSLLPCMEEHSNDKLRSYRSYAWSSASACVPLSAGGRSTGRCWCPARAWTGSGAPTNSLSR